MWLEIFVVIHFIVLPNNISCQPVTDSIHDTSVECCPCSRDDGKHYREPDMSPNSPMGSFAQAEDDCPCRFDSQGSPSLFRPFLLRNSHPSEREQQLKQKPLLEPEVGLASSVLETIQKATDEEYQEALQREASRNLIEIEPSFHDSEAGNSRNSVTIVLNPREDLYDEDAMPEASHVHETRCIHSPLGRSSSVTNDMVPRMSKQKLFLKRKPIGHSSKSFDMDISPNNIQETFDINNNGFSTKLRMNPLILNNLPTGEDINNRMSKVNSRNELGTRISTHNNDFKNELNSPKVRLEALKTRLRDLVEMNNIKRLNNIPAPIRHNNLDIFSNKGDSTAKLGPSDNSPLDPLFDRASPVLKNILKLKDVELLPPKKLLGKDPMQKKLKISDLNVAGSENDVEISEVNEDKNGEDIAELVKGNLSESKEKVLKAQAESDEGSTTDVQFNNSDEVQTSLEEENSHKNSKDSKDALIEEMQRRLDDCLRSANKAQEVVNKNAPTDTIDSYEYDSKEADESEMEDSIPETSNTRDQISQKEVDNNTNKVDSPNLQQSEQERNIVADPSSTQENNGLATFKNDILKKLDNIKKSIKSKLKEPETITNPILSLSYTNQGFSNSDLNSKVDQNIASLTSQPTNDKDITIQDLQNLSDYLLQEKKKLKATTIPLPVDDETSKNNENKDYESTESTESDPKDTDGDEHQASPEDDDPITNESRINNKQENNDLDTSKYTSDTFANNNDARSDTLSKDLETNEMASQASNSEYNAIIPLTDNLRSPTLQDTIELFKTPLQIPSLEEIRQGITDIIDAGQKESEDFQTQFDPSNESSNRNSVFSNPLQSSLQRSDYLGNTLTDRYLRPFQTARNIGGHKSILDNVPLITEPFANPSNLRGYPLSLASDRPNLAGNKNLMALTDSARIPSKEDITRFFESQNHLKLPKINLPKTSLLKRPSSDPRTNSLADDLKYRLDNLKPDFKPPKYGNQLLSTPRIETNNFLQSISRKHDDMKEKLQALHLDFNDRLASAYKKLSDQKRIQSVSTPTFTTKDNNLALPKTALNKERIGQNLKSNRLGKDNFLAQSQLLQDNEPLNRKPIPKNNPAHLTIPLRNNNFDKPKTSAFKGRENIQKLDTNKQAFKPISKVKISFTTPKPLLLPGSEVQNSQDPIKILSRLSKKEKTADLNSNFKDISKALRARYQSLGDSNHAPSEIKETNQLREATNSHFPPIGANNQPRTNYNQADSDIAQNSKERLKTSDDSIQKKMENPLISNLREALRARLQNITNTHTKASKNPVKETNLKEVDAIVSPSNVKTSVLSNPLVENTAYKCTLVCSKDK